MNHAWEFTWLARMISKNVAEIVKLKDSVQKNRATLPRSLPMNAKKRDATAKPQVIKLSCTVLY